VLEKDSSMLGGREEKKRRGLQKKKLQFRGEVREKLSKREKTSEDEHRLQTGEMGPPKK